MSEPRHVLIVEDEPKLAVILSDWMPAEYIQVCVLDDGNEVLSFVRRGEPDLILLDVRLPGKAGLTLGREIRSFSTVPIMMVTARVEEIDRLLGLELGADDYICKPFSPREVVARVKAIIRRSYDKPEQIAGVEENREAPATAENTPAAEGLCLDQAGYRASYQGFNLDLTPAEFRLLLLFTQNPGRVFTREQILDALYDDNRIVTDRTIDTHVKNLRRKLQQANAPEESIVSVYGVGYRYDAC